ncbi:Hpt domain-containing protein [Pararhodobacter sp. SW119]|uniref:Hpt domain-containing protein n=1 Tax=Pararhodobacter sp. SW119 TaxID=2780075 RepID=UPI001ADF2D92|nr:Hpt domain-containing protein [Pararhodobacter sp. SW119]
MTHADRTSGTAIDPAVLNQILDIGDATLKQALLSQLLDDFRRISDALDGESTRGVGAAAHELKGLAATIGAHRLANLALRLNVAADTVVSAELGDFSAPVRGEIRVVLNSLASFADGARS